MVYGRLPEMFLKASKAALDRSSTLHPAAAAAPTHSVITAAMAPEAGSSSNSAKENPAYVPRSKDTDPLGALERYASTPNPETLPAKVRHAHTDTTVTVYDAYPKSIYHLLVLPRPREGLVTVPELFDLKTLLKGDKARAKRILEELGEAAESARRDIEEEMRSAYKCKWEIWTGFHALPSMRYLVFILCDGRRC